jgi:hypothetical protein
MKIWHFVCILVAVVIACSVFERSQFLLPNEKTADRIPLTEQIKPEPKPDMSSDLTPAPTQQTKTETAQNEQADIPHHNADVASTEAPPGPVSPQQNFIYLTYYAYSEVPPEKKPVETILESMQDILVGVPLEEIKRACEALGIDFIYMKAVARIESDFGPTQRTGSYIGLYQLSNYEFDRYGYGNIVSPRDNAVTAAYKFATAAIVFEISTHKKATLSDLYLIHQQGTQGAAEHVSHPERIAWQSMCATEEGHMRGEKWCKRAIWQNTLPDIKHEWKSVEKLTSGAFVAMWEQRLYKLYARYSETAETK